MGKQSTRENKTIYQLCREAQGLTREKASELMPGLSASRIEKFEYELQEPTPYDIIQMADCYKRPDPVQLLLFPQMHHRRTVCVGSGSL